MKDNLTNCPVCENKLIIKKYFCKNCGTEINGNFKPNNFSNLTKEQLEFIEIFVLKRGSIKEIEKELGISYPTVRNKLDEVISALGHKVENEGRNSSKIEILNMLDSGEISSEEASNLLKKLD